MIKNANIKLDYDFRDFESKSRKVIDKINADIDESVKRSAEVFASAAAKYTWPNRGRSTIERKYYTRPYLVLSRLLRGGYKKQRATDEDKKAFKRGMLYKVLDTRAKYGGKRSRKLWDYAMNKTELRQLQHIDTRGLARVMWGKKLTDIGMNVPTTIQNLMRKAKRLQRLDYNKVTFSNYNEQHIVDIENRAEGVDKAGADAERLASKTVLSEMRYRLEAIAKRNEEV